MGKSAGIISVLLLLAACGDPLSGVARLTEVDLSAENTPAQALPSEEEIAREGFFGEDSVAPVQDIAEVTPEPAPRGLLGLFRRSAPVEPAPVEPAPAPTAEAPLDVAEAAPAEAPTSTEIDAAVALAAAETPQEAAPARRGFFGLFNRQAQAATVPETPLETALAEQATPEGEAEEVQLASLSDPAAPVQAAPRRGLFARLVRPAAASSPVDAGDGLPEVSYGDVVPYGVIARNCAAKRQSLGRKVETASASGYKIYDSDPRAEGPRTYYITGFADGCPRQLTAAHVLFGSPSFYELLHYGPAGEHLATGATDKAYEKVKRQICGARRGKPCGANMAQLERKTVFVNSYPRADDNTEWSEVLIHDSAVMAQAMKTTE